MIINYPCSGCGNQRIYKIENYEFTINRDNTEDIWNDDKCPVCERESDININFEVREG